MSRTQKAHRALLSVTDKRGLVDFARSLVALGWELISTGGTARELSAAGLPVVPIEEYTGFPEMLDGRLKTLHPRVHGGILYRRELPEHEAAIALHGIVSIDMVVVNLYPFEAVAAEVNVDAARVIENIDIGGPAMIRSAAKNHEHVLVIVDPGRYADVLAALQAGSASLDLRRTLAREAYARTAAYDSAITRWFAREEAGFPSILEEHHEKAADLRYGENPHQRGAFYRRAGTGGPTIGNAKVLPGGKELSYNNYLDADAALDLVLDMPGAAVCIIKHANPCGASSAPDLLTAFARALAGDPVSAFGGIVAFSGVVDARLAEALTAEGTFFEVVIAPGFDADAVQILRTRRKWGESVRLMAVGSFGVTVPASYQVRSVSGGLLVQERDDAVHGAEPPHVTTQRAPSAAERQDLDLAWVLAKHVRSNAIVFVKDGSLVGVGAGQMSRVGSVEIAVRHAGPRARGAVMGSDAFFPFPDGIEVAAAAGVTAVMQPGGSKRDADVIAACNAHKMTMLFTGTRHFRH